MTTSQARNYDLDERLLAFSVSIIRVTERIRRTRAGLHIADQLLRAGTLPYGNHGEAEGAESADDFIHKLKLCYKEFRETRRWLRLVERGDLAENGANLPPLLKEVD